MSQFIHFNFRRKTRSERCFCHQFHHRFRFLSLYCLFVLLLISIAYPITMCEIGILGQTRFLFMTVEEMLRRSIPVSYTHDLEKAPRIPMLLTLGDRSFIWTVLPTGSFSS